MKHVRQKQFWIVFWSATVALLFIAYFVDQHFIPRPHSPSLITLKTRAHTASVARSKPEPPSLTESASLAPELSGKPSARPTASPTPIIAPAPTAGPSPAATPSEDLRDSARRAEAVDSLGDLADSLFADQANVDGEWTVNQQGLNQEDYQLSDGTYITSWFDAGAQEGEVGRMGAQEAQLPNGEVVDRWFNKDGTVSQIMHEYDRNHSITVYYYENGAVEAMRVVDGGHEVFSRYDNSGRLLEKTIN